MNAVVRYATSAIGSKKFVALSGLGWSLFLLMHMAGNLLIFVGPDAYNMYGHKIVTNPLILVAELGLVAMLLAHVAFAVFVTVKNKRARTTRYAVTTNGDNKAEFGSRTLIYQGVIILVFIILHLATFKYGAHYETVVAGEKVRDLFRLMTEVFKQPGYVVWYIVALLILGTHLSHGVAACLQSLGLNNAKWDPTVRKVGHAFALLVILGFIAQPLFMFFRES